MKGKLVTGIPELKKYSDIPLKKPEIKTCIPCWLLLNIIRNIYRHSSILKKQERAPCLEK